jgi:hypothetical protein
MNFRRTISSLVLFEFLSMRFIMFYLLTSHRVLSALVAQEYARWNLDGNN